MLHIIFQLLYGFFCPSRFTYPVKINIGKYDESFRRHGFYSFRHALQSAAIAAAEIDHYRHVHLIHVFHHPRYALFRKIPLVVVHIYKGIFCFGHYMFRNDQRGHRIIFFKIHRRMLGICRHSACSTNDTQEFFHDMSLEK